MLEKELLDSKVVNKINEIKNKKNYNQSYMKVKDIKSKVQNSKSFSNVKSVRDDGTILLKTGELACLLEINAVDLSLCSKQERNNFFYTFKDIFRIKDIKLKCIKLDKKINLNPNKENYSKLIKRFSDDEIKRNLLELDKQFIDEMEKNNQTLSSSYYFILIANTIEILNKQINEIDIITNSLIPKIYVETVTNKLEVYKFLCDYYLVDVSLEQLVSLDFPELISPSYISERTNVIKVDDKTFQLICLKKIPPFFDEMFLESLFNIPKVRVCMNISNSEDTETIIKRLDKNYGSLLSDRINTKKLSDATEMDLEKENNKILMSDLKNGNEIVKNVSLIFLIEGTEKEREELYLYIKRLAEREYKMKVDIPKLRQMEVWQNYDITPFNLKDYEEEFPTLTLAGSFPFTLSHFNDYKGYLLGCDYISELPIFFDLFHLNKKTRTSHNLAIISTTGGGKSFTIKKIIVNEFIRGTKIFILDPDGEYKDLVINNGGEYIDLYSKSNGIINPLQIRYIENEDENNNTSDYPLPKHLSYLESFFEGIFGEISQKELIVLTKLLEKLYNKKNIYSTTTIKELEKLKNTDYPIFDDLISFIPEFKAMNENKGISKIIDQLEILLSRFTTGTDSYLFNGYTTVDLSNDLIGFNLRDLLYSDIDRLKSTQIINLLTYLTNAMVSNKIYNDNLEEDKKRPICIVADEFHLFNNEKDGKILKHFGQLARRIRKYYGSLIVASQSIHDFVGSEETIRHAKAVFNNCQYQLIGMLQESDLLAYLDLFKENPLTDIQKSFLLKAGQGNFLFSITRKKKIRISIYANYLETKMMGELKNEIKN